MVVCAFKASHGSSVKITNCDDDGDDLYLGKHMAFKNKTKKQKIEQHYIISMGTGVCQLSNFCCQFWLLHQIRFTLKPICLVKTTQIQEQKCDLLLGICVSAGTELSNMNMRLINTVCFDFYMNFNQFTRNISTKQQQQQHMNHLISPK